MIALHDVVKYDNMHLMGESATPRDRAVPSAAALSLKNALAERIVASVDRQGLTVREAEVRTGQAAADFSRLRGGDLDRFTIDRLLTIAEALGERISVSLSGGEPVESEVPTPLLGHLRELRILCRRYAVRRLAAFGSVTRADFDAARSDLDLTVEFGVSRTQGPADQYFRFKSALEKLFGRGVDLVELKALPDSRLKRSIERTQVSVYEQVA